MVKPTAGKSKVRARGLRAWLTQMASLEELLLAVHVASPLAAYSAYEPCE